MEKLAYLLTFSVLFLLYPKSVDAHAFGVLYTLPVPFWLYLYGAAAALIISFLAIGYFFRKPSQTSHYPRLMLSSLPLFPKFSNRKIIAVLKIVSLCLFGLTILTGLLGKDSPTQNFNMTFFWIIFILGFTYLSVLVGNLWELLNPWKIISDYYERLTQASINGYFSYPRSLSYLPALGIYFVFIWLELLGETSPSSLSAFLLDYTVLNFIGVFLVGKKSWFQYCEFFSVFFRLISQLSLLEYSAGKFYLRPPFVGLLGKKAAHFSLTLFILFMLSSTAFDSFRETQIWYEFYFRNFGDFISINVFQTLGLIISPLIFLLVYELFIFAAKKLGGSELSTPELALQFGYSLIPIALAYNVAHYYTLLLTQGQQILKIISDPFALGWNLFGTAHFVPDLGLLDANFIWHSQVAVILVGHIGAVYLAHLVALETFPASKKALYSQVPMLLLMVLYTLVGLWLLSQPLAPRE